MFQLKSTLKRPRQSISLQTFIQNIETDINSFQPKSSHNNNLSRPQKQALYNLKNRSDIVIKLADKGSAVVILDRDHYISEAERQLKDTNFYKPLDYDPTLEFADKVSSVVEDVFKQGEKNKD